MKKSLTSTLAAAILGFGIIGSGAGRAADAGNAEKGKEVFEQCSACHNVDNNERKMGPSLKGLYKHEKLKNGKKVTDANVKAMVNAGGNGMPAYADMLSEQEKNDVIAYLHTI